MNIKNWFKSTEGPIEMEAVAKKMQQDIQKMLERRQKTAFLAGFLASCESWNGEYPYEGSGAAWRDGVGNAYARWVEGQQK